MAEARDSPSPATTLERLPDLDLTIEQPAQGYRYNQDPFHLARFITDGRKWENLFSGECLDLGCGVGILPLLLARQLPKTRFTGIEIQPDLARLARANARHNQLAQRFEVLTGDYRELCAAPRFQEHFNAVVSNPPYYPVAAGRRNRCPQKELARHEIAGNINDLVQAVSQMLKPKGIFCLVFPAARLFELSKTLQARQLEPKQLRVLHPAGRNRATGILLAARKGSAPGVIIEPTQAI